MRKIYKQDTPAPKAEPQPKRKREKKPAPIIAPIDPEEWPEDGQVPVKGGDDGG